MAKCRNSEVGDRTAVKCLITAKSQVDLLVENSIVVEKESRGSRVTLSVTCRAAPWLFLNLKEFQSCLKGGFNEYSRDPE